MSDPMIDWPATANQALLAHELLDAERANLDSLPLRNVVRESWKRALSQNDLPAEPAVLSDEGLRLVRERSELQSIWPVFERLLVPAATDANLLVALADARGTLLWVAGSNAVLSSAERVGFAAGADWAEPSMGTSAPGMALATGRGSQVSGAEHLYEQVQHFNCSAVPIRNPKTGRVIGAIDLTGGAEAIALHSIPLLQAAVAAAEGQLMISGMSAKFSETDFLDLCGLDGVDLSGQPIALRHAEILTLLAQYPRGLSSAELVDGLFERPDSAAVGTVRAEMVRLRKMLSSKSERLLSSRPYRLQWKLETTLTRLWKSLESGDLQAAIDLYAGDLLARTQAPAILELRRRAQLMLREVALDHGNAQQLLHLGRQFSDAELLRAALRDLPAEAPARSLIVAEVESLES
ncbi:transcriptional regulator [Glutamicibacter arilaitensis]|uniref:transcriptional regulator n=1 Tax=Glutamicibacter arilaitensis TaxID=256701 RepID=UPI0038515DF0